MYVHFILKWSLKCFILSWIVKRVIVFSYRFCSLNNIILYTAIQLWMLSMLFAKIFKATTSRTVLVLDFNLLQVHEVADKEVLCNIF